MYKYINSHKYIKYIYKSTYIFINMLIFGAY